MNEPLQSNPFDENLRRMLESAVERPNAGFQDRLVNDVLAEVAKQRGLGKARSWQRPWRLAAAAAAVILIGTAIWIGMDTFGRTIGQVSRVYGMVGVQEDGSFRSVGDGEELRSGQRVETHSGSQAQIVLADQSRLTPDPRTRLQIARTRRGPKIVLEQGTIRLQAAKQPAGRSISIAAADSHIKVLGTDLEVRLVNRPDGTQQTRVQVRSGQVELGSAGQTVMIWPGTEGMAEKGKAPVRSSVVFEVNEMIQLYNKTAVLAKEAGLRPGLPAIVDATSGTLWTAVRFERFTRQQAGHYTLTLRYPAFYVRAFTGEGERLATEGKGRVLDVDLSHIQGTNPPEYLILQMPGVQGLWTVEDGAYEFQRPLGDPTVLSLVQFHLPLSARVDVVYPGP